jgi:hypothetical protein
LADEYQTSSMLNYGRIFLMERVKLNKVIVSHGDSERKFPVYEIYLDGVIVTKVSSEAEATEMVSRWQEIYK